MFTSPRPSDTPLQVSGKGKEISIRPLSKRGEGINPDTPLP